MENLDRQSEEYTAVATYLGSANFGEMARRAG